MLPGTIEAEVADGHSKRDAIVELCEKYGVVRLDVFGSVLRDDFCTARSDIDLLVDFSDREPYALAQVYFDLLDDLERLLGTKVDLVMAGAVKNPYIAADIEETKQLLYAA
jgi:predicted nucleotidyltransferase